MLHRRAGFRYSWFVNDTPVVAAAEVTLCPADVLVVPETSVAYLDGLPEDALIVVFNQNAYQTFSGLATGPAVYRRVSQIVAVSQDNAALLSFALPGIPVSVISPSIDPTIFYPLEGILERRLAYMPRRRGEDARELVGIMGDRMDGWEIMPIDGLNIEDAARVMRECPIFLSLSRREGFGLPPAEAMSSGAYVVGFTGLAGREFMLPQFSMPIPEDDLRELAIGLQGALRAYEDDAASIRSLGRSASRFISDTYAPAREARLIVETFGSLIDGRDTARRRTFEGGQQ